MSENSNPEQNPSPEAMLKRMLLGPMPDALRQNIQALLARAGATEHELQSACEAYAKQLVLARPRSAIRWNPAVDAQACIGCGVCHDYCTHGVYAMRDGLACVIQPTGCVILCSRCASRCPVGAIHFPTQKTYRELLLCD